MRWRKYILRKYVLVCYAAHVVCLLLCSKDQRISKDVSSTPKNGLKIVHKVDPKVKGAFTNYVDKKR